MTEDPIKAIDEYQRNSKLPIVELHRIAHRLRNSNIIKDWMQTHGVVIIQDETEL